MFLRKWRNAVCVGLICLLFIAVSFGVGIPLGTRSREGGCDDQILWWYNLAAPSFGSSAVGDIDEDGSLEIVFGTYFNDEHVYALNAEDGSLLWRYDTGGCNDASPVIADVDLDGDLEVVIPASSPSMVYCFNGKTGAVEWTRSTGSSNCIDSPPAVADVDNDDAPEILFGTFYGNVFCLNGEDGSIFWQRNLGSTSYIQSEPAVLDLNNDGQLDVVVAQFAGDCRVYALWGNNGSILWYSDLPSDYMYHGCSFADLDRDGAPEVVIGCYDSHVYVFNGEDGSLAWQYVAPSYIGAPTSLGDLNNDGYYEIVFVSYNMLGVLSHTGTLLWSATTAGNMFRGAALADVDGDGALDVLFGSEDGILRALRGSNGQILWTVDLETHYGRVFQMDHAPVIADFNNDGGLDVFIVGGYGASSTPADNHGRAYALSAGDGTGAGWMMFRHDCRRSGCAPVSSNQPPIITDISGPVYGQPARNYTFCITVSDPEGDQFFCLWNWDDGTTSGWLGPFPSGSTICATHAWDEEGTYGLRVKLKDESGQETPWSDLVVFIVDGISPSVEITQPKSGFLYLFDRQILPFFTTLLIGRMTVMVTADDALSGVSHVQVFIDDALEENLTSEPYIWLWDQRSFSKHTLQVVVYDHAGNTASQQRAVWKFF